MLLHDIIDDVTSKNNNGVMRLIIYQSLQYANSTKSYFPILLFN